MSAPNLKEIEWTFQGNRREALRIQVGNEKLGIAVFYFNTDDPERKGSKISAFWR